jgi:hypothetical protein
VNRVTLNRRAEEALRHDLQPGERIAVGSAVASDPSRWGAAALLTVALALTVAGLANLLGLLGPLPAGPFIALAPVLGLGIQFLPRPMYVAVTDRRLICCRLSRLRGILGRPVFAVLLADLRVVNYRSSKWGNLDPAQDSWAQAHAAARQPGPAQELRRARDGAGALRRIREAGPPVPLSGEPVEGGIQIVVPPIPVQSQAQILSADLCASIDVRQGSEASGVSRTCYARVSSSGEWRRGRAARADPGGVAVLLHPLRCLSS